MIYGDDALELSEKTLPSASAFCQASSAICPQQRRAATLLSRLMTMGSAHAKNVRTMFLMLWSHGSGFETALELIDGRPQG